MELFNRMTKFAISPDASIAKTDEAKTKKQNGTSVDAWISSVKEGAAGFCAFRPWDPETCRKSG